MKKDQKSEVRRLLIEVNRKLAIIECGKLKPVQRRILNSLLEDKDSELKQLAKLFGIRI